MRVFLDANILFSASNTQSNIAKFLKFASSKHEFITSYYAYAEAERNIILKRPIWQSGFNTLSKSITVVVDSKLPDGISVTLAEKDIPILATAITTQCDYLLTGDKRDFGHLYNTKIADVTVVDYLRLAEIMLPTILPFTPSK